jgi:hypothetical protein
MNDVLQVRHEYHPLQELQSAEPFQGQFARVRQPGLGAEVSILTSETQHINRACSQWAGPSNASPGVAVNGVDSGLRASVFEK